jgi:hypothetical protein
VSVIAVCMKREANNVDSSSMTRAKQKHSLRILLHMGRDTCMALLAAAALCHVLLMHGLDLPRRGDDGDLTSSTRKP